jgi:hypothetical protein
MSEDLVPPLTPVPGRSCDGCTLCCKIFAIPELPKPRHEWCKHCDTGKGCNVYETRPQTCRDFYCGYLLMPNLPEHWKPSRSRMVLTWESHANRMVINVDGGRPDAWKKEPYYAQIKKWAVAALKSRGQVLLWQGKDAFAILPNRDVFLGPLRVGQGVAIVERRAPGGAIELDAIVVEDRDGKPGAPLPQQR